MPQKLTTKKFIERAKKVHGNTYGYFKVNYINDNTKIEIMCKIHGSFLQKPGMHIRNKNGCPKCGIIKAHKSTTLTAKQFIEKAIKIHGNKYDYSKTNYVNNQAKVIIICRIHGEFEQTPHNHLKKRGCKLCNGGVKKTIHSFVEKANKIHNNKYDYSKFIYLNSKVEGIIICYKHGEFKQKPNNHLNGTGCPKCYSSKGEKEIRKWLIKNNILFEEQKMFNNCAYKKPLKFDFYLPNFNTLIEYDGPFHFKETTLGNNLTESLIRDKIKDEYCIKNNINLVRIGFWEDSKKALNIFLSLQKYQVPEHNLLLHPHKLSFEMKHQDV